MVLINLFFIHFIFIISANAEIYVDTTKHTNNNCQRIVQSFLYELRDSFPEQNIFLNPANQIDTESKKDFYFSLQCSSEKSLKIIDQLNRVYNLDYSMSFNGFKPFDWHHFTESFNIYSPKKEESFLSFQTQPVSGIQKEKQSFWGSKSFWFATAAGVIATTLIILIKNSSSQGVQVEIQ